MKYEVKSFSGNQPYTVEAHDEGKRWTCTCPHFVHRLKKSGTHCKHIDKVIEDNARNEKVQAEIAAKFDKGYGFDLDEEKPKDVSVVPAS